MKYQREVCGSQVLRSVEPGAHVTTLQRPMCEEFFITVVPGKGESPESLFQRAGQIVRQCEAQVILQDVFGIRDRDGAFEKELLRGMGPVQWPITWVEGPDQPACTGTFLWAVRGLTPQPLRVGERIVGTAFDDGQAQYCRMAGVFPGDKMLSREDQATDVFRQMKTVLGQVGMDFSNVARTWYYNEDILGWYSGFNRVRTDFFQRDGVFDGLVPASTGIGGSNPSGAALVAGALALDSDGGEVTVRAVESPLQCSACDYGSSFSRAVEISTPDHRLLTVSGTASIEPGGKTVHLGDLESQIELTYRVVERILESCGMDFSDTLRGTAYVCNLEDVERFERHRVDLNLPEIPLIVANNVICRDDLLFELELDAMVVL